VNTGILGPPSQTIHCQLVGSEYEGLSGGGRGQGWVYRRHLGLLRPLTLAEMRSEKSQGAGIS